MYFQKRIYRNSIFYFATFHQMREAIINQSNPAMQREIFYRSSDMLHQPRLPMIIIWIYFLLLQWFKPPVFWNLDNRVLFTGYILWLNFLSSPFVKVCIKHCSSFLPSLWVVLSFMMDFYSWNTSQPCPTSSLKSNNTYQIWSLDHMPDTKPSTLHILSYLILIISL